MPLTERRPWNEYMLFLKDGAFTSAGHTTPDCVMSPITGKIVKMGLQNQHSTTSITSTVTLALTLCNVNGSTTVTSTNLNTTGNIAAGCGISIPPPNETLVSEGDGIYFTSSGGNAVNSVALFCIVRASGV